MKKLTVALIGLEHIHSMCLYEEFSKHPDKFEIIGCADVPPIEDDIVEDIQVRLERNLQNGLKDGIKVFDDYMELANLKPDLALVCSNMRSYPWVVEKLLGMGINTLVEKPMAMDFEGGLRMYNAYKNSSAFLVINWPVAWFEHFQKVKELVDAGEIGEVFRVHYRSPATLGPYKHDTDGMSEQEIADMKQSFWYNHSMGGGSSLDYGGYGCTLATWIFGKQAEKVSGIRRNYLVEFSDVEDYVSYTLDFGKQVAIIEGSWSTVNNGEVPTGPIVFGSKGVIAADRGGREVKVYKTYSRWSIPPEKVYQCSPWEKPPYTLPENIYDHIVNGTPLNEMITPEFNIKALAALDAGIRSSYSEKWEKTKSVE